MPTDLTMRWVIIFAIFVIGIFASGLTASRWAMAASDDASGYPAANPLAGDPDAIKLGGRLYFKWCAQCHGKNADGVSERFGKYAKDLRKFRLGYAQFVVVVLNGRLKKRMPRWGGVLDEDEIAQIGAFLETLAIEGARWKK